MSMSSMLPTTRRYSVSAGLVEFLDNLYGRVGRRADAGPEARFVAGHGNGPETVFSVNCSK